LLLTIRIGTHVFALEAHGTALRRQWIPTLVPVLSLRTTSNHDVPPPINVTHHALARSSTAICSVDNFSVVALTRSPTCSGFEALAMGPVMPGRAINQASATCIRDRAPLLPAAREN
jgi:hypothetical protein